LSLPGIITPRSSWNSHWSGRLGPPGEEAAPFIEYGWGDRRFYMDSNFWPHALFATVFLPTASVVYLDGWQSAPVQHERVHEIYYRAVSAAQLRDLVTDLERAMPRTRDGQRPAPLASANTRTGRFYPGRECYIFWSDCNQWTVRRLAAAGLATSGMPIVFKQQVAGRLSGFKLLNSSSRNG